MTQQTLESILDTVDGLCLRFKTLALEHSNPYSLDYNCVFLSIAHLLGKTLSGFLTSTEQMQPNVEEDTPGLPEVAQMLNETGKQIFDYQPDPVRTITGSEADEIENQICYVFSISEHHMSKDVGTAGAEADGAAVESEGSEKAINVDEPEAQEPDVQEEPEDDDRMDTNDDHEMAGGTNQD